MKGNAKTTAPGGLARWLLDRLHGSGRQRPRLELLERIALAPRQSLALVEAEGRRFLVATSPEGAPFFYPLDGELRAEHPRRSTARVNPLSYPVACPPADRFTRNARVSW
jgi:flagellar biogenesis protein FliO